MLVSFNLLLKFDVIFEENFVKKDGVTSIGGSAFEGCASSANITIESGSTLVVPSNKWGATNANVIKE